MSSPTSRPAAHGAGAPTQMADAELEHLFADTIAHLGDVEDITPSTRMLRELVGDVESLKRAIGDTRVLRDLGATSEPAWFDTRLAAHQKVCDRIAEDLDTNIGAVHCTLAAALNRADDAFAVSKTAAPLLTQARHEAAMAVYAAHREVIGWRISAVLLTAVGVLIGLAL